MPFDWYLTLQKHHQELKLGLNLVILIVLERQLLKRLQKTKTPRGLHNLWLENLLVVKLNRRGVVQLKLLLFQFLDIEVLVVSPQLVSYWFLGLLINPRHLICRLLKLFLLHLILYSLQKLKGLIVQLKRFFRPVSQRQKLLIAQSIICNALRKLSQI